LQISRDGRATVAAIAHGSHGTVSSGEVDCNDTVLKAAVDHSVTSSSRHPISTPKSCTYVHAWLHKHSPRPIFVILAKSQTRTKVIWQKVESLWQVHPTPRLYSPRGSIGLTVWLQFAIACFGCGTPI